MAEAFLTLSLDGRREALGMAADSLGCPPHLLEKDVWVVWAQDTLFNSPVGNHLVFKGGTSLSKAYGISLRVITFCPSNTALQIGGLVIC